MCPLRSLNVPSLGTPYLEKAYDRIPWEELWYSMRKLGIQDMYEGNETLVRCAAGKFQCQGWT